MYYFLSLNTFLIKVFLGLALLASLQMLIFRISDGLDSYKNIDRVANWSFGSMGYPSNLCAKNLIDWQGESDKVKLIFECQGQTSIKQVFSSGIISYLDETDYPGLVEVFGKCYYDPDRYDASLFYYQDTFDSESFNDDLLDQCAGQ